MNPLHGYTINASNYAEHISGQSTALYETLLEMRQPLPEGTALSAGPDFEQTREEILDYTDDQLIENIGPLIVPSAEQLAGRGLPHLLICRETVDEPWHHAIVFRTDQGQALNEPDPWRAVGFRLNAFTLRQRAKIIAPQGASANHAAPSFFAATDDVYFPFLTAEIESGATDLAAADLRNTNSQLILLCGLLALFRAVGREHELHREIKGFSISFNARDVRIWGHFWVIHGTSAVVHRHPIAEFRVLSEATPRERWTAYTFVRNLYDLWVPGHHEWICSAIDMLPTPMPSPVLPN